MKKLIIIALIILALAGGFLFMKNRDVSYQDGVYEGAASGNFGQTKVKITLKDNKIVDCVLTAIDKDGNVKNENYGRDSGEKNYQLAQIALNGMMKYPEMLIKAENLKNFEKLDAVSGATVAFKEMQAAVKEALDKAK